MDRITLIWGMAMLVLIGVFASMLIDWDPPASEPAPPEEGGTSTGLLILGAACEQDSDCVYALNAYPIQECVSQNCPPFSSIQPEPGDPAYEWKDTYLDECVNANDLGGKNVQGEELLIAGKGNNCTCVPFASPDGFPTSLDGQKLCRKILTDTSIIPENEAI